jgi:hypothetical protein
MRQAGVGQAVIMKRTGPKTPSLFQPDNAADRADAPVAGQNLEGLLGEGQNPGN